MKIFLPTRKRANSKSHFLSTTKSLGDVVIVDDKEVVILKFLAWIKDKTATCSRFDGKLGDGTPVTVVLDGEYKIQ
jgi:hypothetical protein